MSGTLTGFAFQIAYLFQHLTASDLIDILVVSAIFFVIFQALHRTRTLQLLRGAIIGAILGAASLVLLPLNTLGWLVRIVLIAGLISLPILFQDELRKVLTGLGQIGRKRYYGSEFEDYKSAIVGAVKNLSTRQHGALIVLEGRTPLEDIIETGISIETGPVSSELLQTIFFPNTPLHDGAVILRGNRIVSASCILPVETEKTGDTHLGTRHRAALGLSAKVPDAMIIVVSEETRRISVAQTGQIYMGLTLDQLGGRLERFREQMSGNTGDRWQWLQGVGARATLTNIAVAVILSIVAWLSVTYQTNPPQQVNIDNVPLVLNGPDPGLLLMSEIPAVVNVQIQTTRDRIDELNAANIRASISVEGFGPGDHRVPVQVEMPDLRSQVVWVKPTNMNVLLETEVTQIFTPTVKVLDISSLPIGYSLSEITVSPQTLTIQGPKSQIENIREARLELEIENRRSDFQESIAPKILSMTGEELAGLIVNPDNTVVSVPIKQNFFTKEVSIRANVNAESVETGYEIRSIDILPMSVTLSGNRSAIDAAGDYVNTAPINLESVFDNLVVNVPLEIPDDIRVLDEAGDPMMSVQVKIDIAPVNAYLVLEKNIELRNIPAGITARPSQASITVLMIGPSPLLKEIENNQDLLVIYLDLSEYEAGSYSLSLRVDAPPDIQILLFPSEIQLDLSE